MMVYRITDTFTGEVQEGHAKDLTINGVPATQQMISDYATKGCLYLRQFKVERIGKDNVKHKRRTRSEMGLGMSCTESEKRRAERNKAEKHRRKNGFLTPLEQDNEEARSVGKSYGNHKLEKDKDFYEKAYQAWLEFTFNGQRKEVLA